MRKIHYNSLKFPKIGNKFRFFPQRYVYVIAWARGQLRINFTCIFKVFTKLPESRSDEGNLENFEIQVKLILNCLRVPAITCLSHKGLNYRGTS